MRKATFVRKYYGHGYDAHMVYLDYMYRGHEYTVEENLLQGNRPLAWQHRDEQSRIDQLIEQEEKEKNAKPKPCRYETPRNMPSTSFITFSMVNRRTSTNR